MHRSSWPLRRDRATDARRNGECRVHLMCRPWPRNPVANARKVDTTLLLKPTEAKRTNQACSSTQQSNQPSFMIMFPDPLPSSLCSDLGRRSERRGAKEEKGGRLGRVLCNSRLSDHDSSIIIESTPTYFRVARSAQRSSVRRACRDANRISTTKRPATGGPPFIGW